MREQNSLLRKRFAHPGGFQKRACQEPENAGSGRTSLHKWLTIGLLSACGTLFAPPIPVQAASFPVRVTVTNMAPEKGVHLTPPWIGFHSGSFDLYDRNDPASEGIERLAEDGNPAPLSDSFGMNAGEGIQGVLDNKGPLAPGESVSLLLRLSPDTDSHRFFSYASMVIPSNDAFIANDNSEAIRLFNDSGKFVGADFVIGGSEVLDAGTEINDETPAHTAFFGQMSPDTGDNENGMIRSHSGFKAPGEGGILDDPMFQNADFTQSDSKIARIQIERLEPRMLDVRLTFKNKAPENGTYLTPVWVGFHNGSFDLFTAGESASTALERLAEDGNADPLVSLFKNMEGGGIQQMVTHNPSKPPFPPGAAQTITVTLDAHDPANQYLSFASMVIPSNDAFIGNDDPTELRLFDAHGNFVATSITRKGAQVYDAGSEVNDEMPQHTAFFGQTAPKSGQKENGVVHPHSGFMPKAEGGILDDPMFAHADFTQTGFEVFALEPSLPLQLLPPKISGNQLQLEWVGGNPPYKLQLRESVSEEWSNFGDAMDGTSASISIENEMGFVRVVGTETEATETAMYEVVFDATWSAETHPDDFPSNPHFSGLIGATHRQSISFWQPGETASPGIELMAETGGKSTLKTEIQAAIDAGTADRLLSGGGINPSPGQVRMTFQVDREFSRVTLVSMIAPSPDWFVGVHGLSLMENGKWVDKTSIELSPYDAGTDNGSTYSSANADSDPQDPIRRIEGSPLEVDGEVPPLGSFTFQRIDK